MTKHGIVGEKSPMRSYAGVTFSNIKKVVLDSYGHVMVFDETIGGKEYMWVRYPKDGFLCNQLNVEDLGE